MHFFECMLKYRMHFLKRCTILNTIFFTGLALHSISGNDKQEYSFTLLPKCLNSINPFCAVKESTATCPGIALAVSRTNAMARNGNECLCTFLYQHLY